MTGSNGLMMDWANGRLIHELSEKLEATFSVAVFSDPSRNSNHKFPIQAHKVYALPFPFSYAGGIKNILKIRRILKQIERENDMLIIQLPFIGFPALLMLRRKPTVYH
ncbi:MAG TPA: hypothetical protein VFM90_03380, partial [Cyclobacteriaceae bacterium]|nr:hypothetical protein [Cyclobacteriaceae bacterium]